MSKQVYDVIVIGGGIAGLNTVYEIQKQSPYSHILLLEKSHNLGGRVYTYHDRYMTVEAGAGRFHNGQQYLMKLLKEMKLENKIIPISSDSVYAPIEDQEFKSSVFDAPTSNPTAFDAAFNFVYPKTIPNAALLAKVIAASKIESKNTLINMSFSEFAETVLTKEEVDYIKASFGYYSELVIMNAKDAIDLMVNNLNPSLKFNVLQGGLSQLIENLKNKIEKQKHTTIMMHREVKKIIYDEQEQEFELSILNTDTNKTHKYKSKICICALPKQVLEKLPIFKPIHNSIRKIECSPLCRIYCKFPVSKNQAPSPSPYPWFKGLPKLTTNNNVRMVIPMSEKDGVIMISYTDNKYAEFWNDLYKKGGVEAVNRELTYRIKETTKRDMPEPIKTKVCYWSCGVGYWGIGADSEKVSKEIMFPFENIPIYVCGEHYSEKNQQWIEGALETSQKIVDYLFMEI